MLDVELKQGIRNHSPRTYETLIDEYSKLLWVVASGVLKNIGTQEDIEDCVAESFAYLWEYSEKYDERRGSIKTYLCLITKSKAIDKVRKINRTKTLTEIIRKMEQGIEKEDAGYFIEDFKTIDKNTNFYISEEGKLVIVFNEYEIAAGYMGMPEFTINTSVFENNTSDLGYLK